MEKSVRVFGRKRRSFERVCLSIIITALLACCHGKAWEEQISSRGRAELQLELKIELGLLE